VAGLSGRAQTFQWIETPTGELVLMSFASLDDRPLKDRESGRPADFAFALYALRRPQAVSAWRPRCACVRWRQTWAASFVKWAARPLDRYPDSQ
jgi:hypothetical protein